MFNERCRQLFSQKLQLYLEPEQINLLQRTDLSHHMINKITSLNLIKESVLYTLLSDIIHYPYRELYKEKISTLYTKDFYQQYRVILLENYDLVMVDPFDIQTKNIIPQRKNIFLGAWPNMQQLLLKEEKTLDLLQEILKEAVDQKASDIHFLVEENTVVVRFRLQGILRKYQMLSIHEWNKIIVRLKVKSHLDISETRRPQSGHFSVFDDVDFRISTHPTIYGENIVIRVLEKNKEIQNIETLGFEIFQVQMMKLMIQRNIGLLLICGPTGSGKTTTLYSLFHEIDNDKKSVMTLEEPVEYKISGITQSEIIHDDIMGYADGIKSMLRQDPDIIFIGEIRDENTAKMAFRAAMTGHFVIATIHTFNVLSSIYRLMDLGVSKEFLKSALCGVIAQRLIRCICEKCQGSGCNECYFDGLYKRQAIGEVLIWSDEIKELLDEDRLNESILKTKGFMNLYDIFKLKVQQNITLEKEQFEL